MKLIIAVLLVISARVQGKAYDEAAWRVECRPCNQTDYDAVSNNKTKIYNCVGPLNTHGVDGFKPKCPDAKAFMGPCANTFQCLMPDCCGIISGIQSCFAVNITKGACAVYPGAGDFSGSLQAVKVPLGNTTELRVPTLSGAPLPIGGYAAQYEHDLCKSIDCPVEKDAEQYLRLFFRFPATALTSATVKADFVAEFNSKNCSEGINPYCILGLNARLVNEDFANSINNTLNEPVSGVNQTGGLEATFALFNALG